MAISDYSGGLPQLEDIKYDTSGTGPRLPLMLCLDTSGSMGGAPIKELNEALREWSTDLGKDPNFGSSVWVGMVTFGSGGVRAWRGAEPLGPASVESPFVKAAQFSPPLLTTGGVTLLTEAMELAIRHVNAYKGALRAQNFNYYRPLVFLLTDGLPTDGNGKLSDSWKRLVPELKKARDAKNLELWAIGIRHLKPEGREVLQGLAPDAFRILGDFPFRTLLRQLSSSIDLRMGGSEEPPPVMTEPSIATVMRNLFGQSPAGQ